MLGNTLRLTRIANDIKIKDASNKSGVSVSFLTDIEKGKGNPSVETVKKLAAAYNIPASTLMLLEEEISDKSLNYQEGLLLILDYYVNDKVPNANYKDENADIKIKKECIKK